MGTKLGKQWVNQKQELQGKKKDGDNDDNDKNEDGGSEPASEEEKIARIAKSKRELRPKSPGKKPSAKRKPRASDTDSEDDNEEDEGATADHNDQKKKPSRVTSRKQVLVGKAPKKLVSNQNTSKPRKKVR